MRFIIPLCLTIATLSILVNVWYGKCITIITIYHTSASVTSLGVNYVYCLHGSCLSMDMVMDGMAMAPNSKPYEYDYEVMCDFESEPDQ